MDVETREGLWSAGWSWGFEGATAGRMLAAVRRELGELCFWQLQALLDGHEVGVRDRESYHADMRARRDEPAAAEPVPF